jgi:hypothetical protein
MMGLLSNTDFGAKRFRKRARGSGVESQKWKVLSLLRRYAFVGAFHGTPLPRNVMLATEQVESLKLFGLARRSTGTPRRKRPYRAAHHARDQMD